MNNNIMVDLETLDTRPTSVILSIGACLINTATGSASHPFYVTVDAQSCLDVGLTQSQSTVDWWAKQSAEARKVFTDPSVSLAKALGDFSNYLSAFGLYRGKSSVRLWGNGSDFDNTIIANAYSALGADAPWHFYNNRCYRTAKDLLQIPKLTRAGTHHNAMDDAVHQANEMLNGLRARNITFL